MTSADGLLGINERILADLIVATRAVADTLNALPSPKPDRPAL